MLKSCSVCGKIHDKSNMCKSEKDYRKGTKLDKFRWSQQWKDKREHIKQRDKYLCQACFNNFEGTINRLNSERLSVHHIRPLKTNYELRLEDSNLITLCDYHHERAEKGNIPAEKLLEITPPTL